MLFFDNGQFIRKHGLVFCELREGVVDEGKLLNSFRLFELFVN